MKKISEIDISKMIINPFYAITISPDLFGEHEPMINKDEWIKANEREIKRLGSKKYLTKLLEVLEGDFPR